MTEKKRVALVVGASRGIGRQVAVDLAKDGYAVVVAAKSTSSQTDHFHPFPPDPNSSHSTITTVAREIHEAGDEATAVQVDVRDPDSIERMVQKTIETYGGLDVLVYNSGAIWWASVESTPMKRFHLMQKVNVEGLYATVQNCLKWWRRNEWKGRIVVVSPPIYSRFFRGKTAYAIGKVGMSVLTKGLGMDFERDNRTGMAITSIWPAVAIQSAATADPAIQKDLRKATIFSDAILAILKAPAEQVNGCLELDEDFLRKVSVRDFSHYSLVPGTTPRRIMPARFPDLTVAEQADEGRRIDSMKIREAKM
ncbi:short chain dehydrogenase [Patellaria atrata CBS 101060]|uniref:Short chain dehydrogenase n=1 Tax=Patellaria atrata CBS 101060 TaxID=1346257 RepID=A0A9P4S8B0_9PEZI|nr:short chain dehydrogenase [Patellaria atrata CBS 101060]